jgi:hypothetical protein
MVVSTWPPAPWDEPLARGSLVGLFLGGISSVVFRAHEHGGHQCWDLIAEG